MAVGVALLVANRRLPVRGHAREIDQRLVIAAFARVLDLLVEIVAGLLGECDMRVAGTLARPLDVLGEARFGSIALRIALGKHLLQQPETIVANQDLATRMTAHAQQAFAETIEIVAIESDVLARMISMALHELRDLRLFRAIDTLDERDTELSVVDAPKLHAARRIVRANVVDARNQPAFFNLDMKPRPLLDRAGRARIGYVVDFP